MGKVESSNKISRKSTQIDSNWPETGCVATIFNLKIFNLVNYKT